MKKQIKFLWHTKRRDGMEILAFCEENKRQKDVCRNFKELSNK